jgi:flagellar M-ring protein FliF
MASKALAHPVLEQINSLSNLHIVRQLGFMLVLAAAIALGFAVVMWSRDQDFAVLYPDLTPQDASAVLAALDQSAIDYRIDQRSGLISVPAPQLQQTRLQLASQGLPRTAGNGFDTLYEESSLGTSNFLEQARYNRALELELTKTVKLIRGVRDARVHLSIPKQSTFLRSGNKASASVMLDIMAGQIVNDIQIAGIAHLVASSVAGLDIGNVSIVDQQGALLSQRQGSELAGSSEHLSYTRNLEQEYTQRILDILAPVVGEGKVRAQVTADLDFTIIETTEENYNPANTVVRSEQNSAESNGVSGQPAPGALALAPPQIREDGTVQAATAGSDGAQSRTNSTRNYEIDKSVSYIRSVPGSIKRLSVAVLVDLQGEAETARAGAEPAPDTTALDAEKLARLNQLVKDTIGYNESRGDSVSVISERFNSEPLFAESAEAPVWEQAWVPGALKQAAASVVVLLLIFAVLKPALQSVVSSGAPQRPALPVGGGDGLLPAVQEPRQVKQAPTKSEYDENLTLAQNLVEHEPARAARMISEWVASD